MKLLVIADNDLFSRWVTVSLATAGHEVRLMTPGTNRLSRLSRYCRAHTSCDSEELRRLDRSLLDRIASYCGKQGIDLVVPADLPAALLLARGVHELKGVGVFPLSEPAVIERLHDKWEFYGLIRELGLPTPPTWRVGSAEEADRAGLEFPLMLKPISGEGGVGVLRIESRAELSAVLDRYGDRYGRPFLAQKFLPGQDIDLSVLADRGRVVAWTVQQNLGGPQNIIQFLHHPRVLEIGSAVTAACRFHGVMHFDMRLDERTKEPFLLEANPRFWGSLRHSLWNGVNFAALGIAMAAGEDVGRQFAPVAGACWDPGLALRPLVAAFLRGRRRPEGWSAGTEVGWRCHLSDPIPELMNRLRHLTWGSRRSALEAQPL
jgi:predicted ATP-grasp superfamily ATP-dependent carboligase